MSENPSFRAVRDFQDIRKITNKAGDIGDDVSALVPYGKGYKIVTGIILKYRSDAGRYVLTEDGTEYSVDHSNVRNHVYVPSASAPVHSEFEVMEHFHMIRKGSPRAGDPYDMGESVAALLASDTESTIVHGRLYGSDQTSRGITYKLVTREGDKYAGLTPSNLAHI